MSSPKARAQMDRFCETTLPNS